MLTNEHKPSAVKQPAVLRIQRTFENSRHTYGSFTLNEENTDPALAGYSVEPGGFSGPLNLAGKKLPAGTYQLKWQFVPGDGNRLVLHNEQVSAQHQVLLGNGGTVLEENSYLSLTSTARYHSGGGAMLHTARDMRDRLEAYVKKVGVANIQVQIEDF